MMANLVPAFHRKLFEATTHSELATARNAHYALLPLVEALYTANHPGPLKDAMALIGHPDDDPCRRLATIPSVLESGRERYLAATP